MKIGNFEPKELIKIVNELDIKASSLKKKVPLLKRIKQWILYFKR